ncbi:MAG: hypothetical protein Q4A01_00450 [Coriobacteriales bacterium]|nr:hypothetical protein [Coriobacteriales bacterium]
MAEMKRPKHFAAPKEVTPEPEVVPEAPKQVELEQAERAVDRAFSTGKADRAAITHQAQLDAEEAVTMAGIAMASDAEADEATRLAVIAAGMSNRYKAREAREHERLARNKAKADHVAATKAAKKAYEAIKFSDPSKLGFVRFVEVLFLGQIVLTLFSLIFTSRNTVIYNSANVSEWILVVLESVAFYFFVNRYKVGRPLVMGIAVFCAVAHIVSYVLSRDRTPVALAISIAIYAFLFCYFAFSPRVKAVLVNDLSSDKGTARDETFVIDRKSWPFYRNLIIYFVVFSLLGHWMEAGMCQFIRLGLVKGTYDPNNTMLWRDWLYPYPMEGLAVVLIALILYPVFAKMREKFSSHFAPYIASFACNAFACAVIEFVGGILVNGNHQYWDYSNMPCNLMGQICLQNTLAFGIVASIITWWVYPAMERCIARVRPAIMNIVCVVVAIVGGILFSLYAINPPAGVNLSKAEQYVENAAEDDLLHVSVVGNTLTNDVDRAQKQLDNGRDIPADQRDRLQNDLNRIREDVAQLNSDLGNTTP